jgi:hypothetical protein
MSETGMGELHDSYMIMMMTVMMMMMMLMMMIIIISWNKYFIIRMLFSYNFEVTVQRNNFV